MLNRKQRRTKKKSAPGTKINAKQLEARIDIAQAFMEDNVLEFGYYSKALLPIFGGEKLHAIYTEGPEEALAKFKILYAESLPDAETFAEYCTANKLDDRGR